VTQKRLKPPLALSSWDSFFSLHEYYFANPNGGSMRNWISNNISKFHGNPTANETGIIVLPRQFLSFCGKLKCYNAKGFPLSSDMILKFPTVRMFGIELRTWYSNFTTIQRWKGSRSSFFWDWFGGPQEKERVLRGEGKKRKWN